MSTKKISRRDFLKLDGTAAGGALLASCAPAKTETPVATTVATTVQTEGPTAVPTKAPPSGTVVLMHRPGANEWSEQNLADFNAQYPDITVELVEDDPTRLFAMLAAGTPPDLFRCQAPFIPGALAASCSMI